MPNLPDNVLKHAERVERLNGLCPVRVVLTQKAVDGLGRISEEFEAVRFAIAKSVRLRFTELTSGGATEAREPDREEIYHIVAVDAEGTIRTLAPLWAVWRPFEEPSIRFDDKGGAAVETRDEIAKISNHWRNRAHLDIENPSLW